MRMLLTALVIFVFCYGSASAVSIGSLRFDDPDPAFSDTIASIYVPDAELFVAANADSSLTIFASISPLGTIEATTPIDLLFINVVEGSLRQVTFESSSIQLLFRVTSDPQLLFGDFVLALLTFDDGLFDGPDDALAPSGPFANPDLPVPVGSIDAFSLSIIPVPASGVLFLAALASLWYAARGRAAARSG
ncbi:MAG: hypothetical protein AAFU80_19725 [Pseudomonadota bacterium]